MIIKKHTALLFLFALTSLCFSQSRIANFSAVAFKDSVRLSFTITQGQSCSGYYILKGSDSTNLTPVYIMPGLCGNSSYPENYIWYDVTPNKATSNFYQVEIPPGDFSKIIRIDLASAYTNMLVFPQPAEHDMYISVNNQKNFHYDLKIINRFGIQVGYASGYCADKITLNIEDFPVGVYIFYVIDQSGNAWRGKFVKS